MLELVVVLGGVGLGAIAYGTAQWTGRWKSWYHHRDPARQLFLALWGTSPLAWILGGLSFLGLLVCVALIPVSLRLAYVPLALVSLPSFAFMLYVLVVRPRWADPPWLEGYRQRLEGEADTTPTSEPIWLPWLTGKVVPPSATRARKGATPHLVLRPQLAFVVAVVALGGIADGLLWVATFTFLHDGHRPYYSPGFGIVALALLVGLANSLTQRLYVDREHVGIYSALGAIRCRRDAVARIVRENMFPPVYQFWRKDGRVAFPAQGSVWNQRQLTMIAEQINVPLEPSSAGS